MDLQEWELLSDNGLLEVLNDDRGKFLSREYASDSKRVPNQLLIPILIQQEPSIQKPQEDEEVIKEVITKVPVEEVAMVQDEEEKVSQVFFKKMKETEFENMKLDSPTFNNKTTSVSQIDSKNSPYEDEVEVLEVEKECEIKKRDVNEENNTIGGINLWNWRLTGVGAICSFGVAAAAVAAATIFFFIGNHQKQKQHKLKFQLSDEKKIKQVVQQPATKLNEAICGVGGPVPLTKKCITDVEGLLLRSLEHIQDCLSVS